MLRTAFPLDVFVGLGEPYRLKKSFELWLIGEVRSAVEDLAVPHLHYSAGHRRCFGVVSDHDNCLLKALIDVL